MTPRMHRSSPRRRRARRLRRRRRARRAVRVRPARAVLRPLPLPRPRVEDGDVRRRLAGLGAGRVHRRHPDGAARGVVAGRARRPGRGRRLRPVPHLGGGRPAGHRQPDPRRPRLRPAVGRRRGRALRPLRARGRQRLADADDAGRDLVRPARHRGDHGRRPAHLGADPRRPVGRRGLRDLPRADAGGAGRRRPAGGDPRGAGAGRRRAPRAVGDRAGAGLDAGPRPPRATARCGRRSARRCGRCATAATSPRCCGWSSTSAATPTRSPRRRRAGRRGVRDGRHPDAAGRRPCTAGCPATATGCGGWPTCSSWPPRSTAACSRATTPA